MQCSNSATGSNWSFSGGLMICEDSNLKTPAIQLAVWGLRFEPLQMCPFVWAVSFRRLISPLRAGARQTCLPQQLQLFSAPINTTWPASRRQTATVNLSLPSWRRGGRVPAAQESAREHHPSGGRVESKTLSQQVDNDPNVWSGQREREKKRKTQTKNLDLQTDDSLHHLTFSAAVQNNGCKWVIFYELNYAVTIKIYDR